MKECQFCSALNERDETKCTSCGEELYTENKFIKAETLNEMIGVDFDLAILVVNNDLDTDLMINSHACIIDKNGLLTPFENKVELSKSLAKEEIDYEAIVIDDKCYKNYDLDCNLVHETFVKNLNSSEDFAIAFKDGNNVFFKSIDEVFSYIIENDINEDKIDFIKSHNKYYEKVTIDLIFSMKERL